jgi:Fungal chitosanase of glycosyl hydrolase group 75
VRFSTATAAFLLGIQASAAWPAEVPCGQHPIAGSFGAPTWQAGDAVGFATPGLAVDADGAPDSYRVDGKGLSRTCDGVFGIVNGTPVTQKTDPAHWQQICQHAWATATSTGNYSGVKIVGFLTDRHGVPSIQGPSDPLPGVAYITTTAMPIPGTKAGTQRHYVDAAQIPYIVLSPALAKAFHVSYGDVAAVYRPRTHRVAYGIYAECCSPGEGSVRLHQDIGNDPIVLEQGIRRAKAGIGDRIVTVVFPGRHTQGTTNFETWRAEINGVGEAALNRWGGLERLQTCAR